jgi:hypothetical protein
MSRTRRRHMGAEARRELEAIDAALDGRPVDAEHNSLATLARELRATRPRADEQFLAALDARAARGFEHAGAQQPAPAGRAPALRARSRALRGRFRLRNLYARPALGLAFAALLAVAVVVPLALQGGHRGSKSAAQHAPLSVLSEPAGARSTFTTERSARAGEKAAASASAAGEAALAPVPSAQAAPARQVERTASLEVGVAPGEIQSKANQVFTLVSRFGGYVRQSNVSSGGAGQGGASFDLRVPSAGLARAIAALSELGHVRSENNTTNDVTDQFNSLESSLADLRAERASVLRQLSRASEAAEETRLKARLHGLDARIAQQQGALGALSGRVNYTALSLTLTPEAAAASKHSELTPGSAASDAGKILEAALAVLVIAAAALIPLGAFSLAAWMVIAATRRRLREQALDAS